MAKDKYDFIQELLGNKSITPIQRERVFLLTNEEIKKDGFLGKNLDERVKRLEELMNASGSETIQNINNDDIETEPDTNQITLPKYYYPSGLYKYLFDYNQNSILKSTCHEIDSSELENICNYCGIETYNYEKHLEKIIEAFSKHDESHFAPDKVKSLIRGYLTGKDYYGKNIKGWSSHEFPFNWSCVSLKNWCNRHQGIPPNLDGGLRRQIRNSGFELSPNITMRNGVLIQKFSDLVIYFKHLFHIRSDNSLRNIIIKENESKSWNVNIDFEIIDTDFPINIEFFTDVDKLVQSYNRIIELIIEQSKNQDSKAIVKLSLTEKNESIEFSMLHRNVIYGKSITNTTDRIGNTYRNLIKNQINGLCNFYVQADFEKDGPYRIGIWDKPNLWATEKPVPIKLDNIIGGVEHIFEIVKHRNTK